MVTTIFISPTRKVTINQTGLGASEIQMKTTCPDCIQGTGVFNYTWKSPKLIFVVFHVCGRKLHSSNSSEWEWHVTQWRGLRNYDAIWREWCKDDPLWRRAAESGCYDYIINEIKERWIPINYLILESWLTYRWLDPKLTLGHYHQRIDVWVPYQIMWFLDYPWRYFVSTLTPSVTSICNVKINHVIPGYMFFKHQPLEVHAYFCIRIYLVIAGCNLLLSINP